jgi:iron complex outermembrane recepter protein
VEIKGTAIKRFDVLVLDGAPIQRQAGTSTADLPKSKATTTLNWDHNAWSGFLRWNHQDKLNRGLTTTTCLTSTTPADTFLRNNGGCYVGAERTYDIGLTYTGIEGLSLSATVLNFTNDYNRSINIPNTFNYWDNGTNGQLGRRLNLAASYQY